MRSYFLIAKNIIKRIFAKPTGYIIHIILPVAVSVCMLLLFAGSGSSKYVVAVVDNSESISSESVLNTIILTDNYIIEHIEEDQVSDYITEGKATVAITFEEDFEEKILNGQDPTVSMYSPATSEGSVWIKNTVNFQIVNLQDLALASNGDFDTYKKLIEDVETSGIEFTSETVSDESRELEASQQMFGMYLMLSLISACTISFLSLKDKRNGIISRIVITPTRPSIYTIANITVNLLIQLSQIVLIILLSSLVFKLSFHAPLAKIILILFTYAICGVSMGQLIVSFAKNESVASAVMSLILTPSCMIGGCYWPIEYMPKVLYNLSFLTPQRWTLDAIKKAQSGESIAMCLLVIFSFSILLFLISVYIVKRKDKKFSY